MPSDQTIALTWHVPGTLSADLSIRQYMQFDAQLIHVSAVSSNAYKAGLEIGIGTDADAYMTKKAIGASGTPAVFDLDDFTGATGKVYPRINAGGILAFALDYDYNNGGASQASADVTITATFLVG